MLWIAVVQIASAQDYNYGLNWNLNAYEKHTYFNATRDSMPYRLLKPFNMDPNQKYPLVIMLHGEGEDLGTTCSQKNGPNVCNLAWSGQMHLDSNSNHPSYVVFPQTIAGSDWSSGFITTGDYSTQPGKPIQLLVGILTELFNNYPNIDLNRIYIHGLSAGGAGVWEMLTRYPHLFAAASPHSAFGLPSKAQSLVCNPIWQVQGALDGSPDFAYRMMDSLNKYGRTSINTFNPNTGLQMWPPPNSTNGRPIFTLVPNTGHIAWPALYQSPTWLGWMFAQSKLNITVFGKTNLNPGESVKLAVSSGYDAYQWSNGATTNQIVVNQPGSYQVRFMRKSAFFTGTSVWSDWSPPVTITTSSTVDITPPSAPGNLNAPSHTYNTVTLNWTASTDNVGVASYQVYSNGIFYESITGTNYIVTHLQPNTTYQFSVKAVDNSGNISVASFISATTDKAVNGLTYYYYEGTWNTLPDFSKLTPKTSGYIENFLLDPMQRATNFAFRYEGFIDIDVTGNYTFYIKSDDGSKLFIDGNTIVNNDSLHGAIEKTGIINLSQGRHAIKVIYFQGTASQLLEVRYSRLGIGRQLIPNSILYLNSSTIDTIAPTIPASLVSTGKNSNSVTLQWNSSTDNVGVTEYDVFVNGSFTILTNTTSATVTNLLPSTIYNFAVKAKDAAGNISGASTVISITTDQVPGPSSVQINNPLNGSSFNSGDTLLIHATVVLDSSKLNHSIPYLKINCPDFAYRKLKLGYNPTSFYNPSNNVTATGNSKVEIIFKPITSGINWSKIQIRPQGNTTTPVIISNYMSTAQNLANGYIKITIPLSAFNSTINFTQLTWIEFPYSAGEGIFEMNLQSIVFTGGSTPFNWFGNGKTNNINDGLGGGGQVLAKLIDSTSFITKTNKVEFYENNILLGSDTLAPYDYSWINLPFGNFALTAKAYFTDNTSVISSPISITVAKPSTGTVQITSPPNGSIFNTGGNLLIQTILNPDTTSINKNVSYLKINCPDNSYRKLKLGYGTNSLSNPTNNVIASGNNKLEIILKQVTPVINWSKIQIRPQGNGTTPITIGNYISSAQSMGNGYIKLTIPISDFTTTIDFTQLTNIEFPYSIGAGIWEMDLQSIVFTGGTTPFNWFGNGKTNNINDGLGGGGQVLASLIDSTSASGITTRKVEFYKNNSLLGSDSISPFQYVWNNLPAGSYALTAKAYFTNNTSIVSKPISVNVNNVNTSGGMKLVVVFNKTPQNYSITNAALRYDKNFAYSFTMDDGLLDAYTNLYPLLGGGFQSFNNTTYPGLNFTDGCGNNVPFRAGLAWNSQNVYGQDTHINNPGILTWDQLIFLNGKGWNILNHSLDHRTGTGTNYDYEVTQNENILKSKTGIDVKHFVIPAGDTNYKAPAFNNGMIAVYNQSTDFPGVGGLQVDGNINLSKFLLFRNFITDDNSTTSNITQPISNVDSKSINGTHYWYNEFTHNVGQTHVGGGLVYSTMEYYMKYIEKTYGKSGKDNVWMAPLEDVYEYLFVRNNIQYTTSLSGNILEITFDTTNIPSYILKRALTLKVNSDADISSIQASGFSLATFRGMGSNKIINLEWTKVNNLNKLEKSGMISESESNFTNNTMIYAYPNPIENELRIKFTKEQLESVSIKIYNQFGVIVKQIDPSPINREEVQLDISTLPHGIYFMKVFTRDKIYDPIKLIKK
jgi:chitodextrinase/predicted esterase